MGWLENILQLLVPKSNDLTSIELKRVIVTNITITLSFFITVVICILLFIVGIYPLNAVFAFCAFLYLICWQIAASGNHFTSKIILFCVVLAQSFALSIILGKSINLTLFYISIALIPLLIFGKRDRKILYLSLLITAANIGLGYYTSTTHIPRYQYSAVVYSNISLVLNSISIVSLITMSGVFVYLTEFGEAESILLNNQLLEKQKELERSKEELDRLNQLKDHLFKIMTHDLKSPLNNIGAMAELMMNEKITREEIKFLSEKFRQTADNTTQMLDNILSWSMRQIDRKESETFSLTNLVNRVFIQVKDKAEFKHIQLLNQIPRGFEVTTDPEMLEIVLRNLVTNSIKFTGRGGQVRVDAISIKSKFIVRVEDNGIGIPKDLITNLFGNNRLSSRQGTNNEKGSGIGLLLCKQLIESCDGKIAIQSEVNRFTIVTLEIPMQC